jgi:hypothetical protein
MDYGVNDFTDNGDGTVTDSATGLMWTKEDGGIGMKWEEALAFVQEKNSENHLGYDDWRLPNAKELQSIVDYTRSLQTTNSPAIDPVFECSSILDEGGEVNYPFYWTNTTHADGSPENQYTKAVYVCFGEALGFMEIPPNSGNFTLMDVHGAGAQRSDPKFGDPESFPYGFGPQGDVIRIFNYVRMVRDIGQASGFFDKGSLPDWIKIYPNPVKGMLNITVDESRHDLIQFEIFDSSGRMVSACSLNSKINTVPTDNLIPGIYFLLIKTPEDHFMEKIIVL